MRKRKRGIEEENISVQSDTVWQERTENIARIFERQKPMALSRRFNTFGVDALYCVWVNSFYLLALLDSVVDSYIN